MGLYHMVLCASFISGVSASAGLVVLTPEDRAAVSLVDEFFQWQLSHSPNYAVSLGIKGYLDKVKIFTEEAFLNEKEGAENFLRRAENVSLVGVSARNKLCIKLLKYATSTFINGYEFRQFSVYNPISTFFNPMMPLLRLVSQVKLTSENDYLDMIARYSKVPQQLQQITDMMNQSIQIGLTQHATGVEDQLNFLETFTSNQAFLFNFFNKPFTKVKPGSIPEDVRTNLIQVGSKAVENWIVPSTKRFVQFLKHEYLPNTRREVGLWSLPNGTIYYQAILNWHTSVSMTPRQVHNLGLQEVDRIKTLIRKVLTDSGHQGNITSFMNMLKTEPENLLQTQRELLSFCVNLTEKAKGKMSNVLKNNREFPLSVSLQNSNDGPPASYSGPDVSGPGTFFINGKVPRAKSDLTAITLHESIPGHHTMTTYTMDLEDPLCFSKPDATNIVAAPFHWPIHTAFIEGWALYAEYLGEEMDMYTNYYDLFGRYTMEMFRALRLVIDTGIHAFGWSREEAIVYMKQNVLLPDKQVESEVDRYITYPGQACAYKIGELKILELRRLAEKQLGAKFDVRDFHHQVLKNGRLPLHLLEDEIKQWIRHTTAPHISASSLAPTSTLSSIRQIFSLCLAVILALRIIFN